MTAVIKHQKPSAFYDEFFRKGPGQKTTHYCPGCGHGVAHKLVAEAIDTLGIQDRTVFCSPVGCSVFGYYYFDTGNVQCSHGRAAAAATGVCRTLDEDRIVISYQGDGDLAGIGMGAIMHAANRGENLTVFFINNAIYGMTGGQMAPTTLIGQKTTTSPRGRTAENEGYPIHMSEIISQLEAPVFVERVTLGDAKGVMKAKRVVQKALKNQVEKRGFSFVEILSPCPIGWKMNSMDARHWITEKLEKIFPLGNFRDDTKEPAPASMPRMKLTDEELIDLFKSGEVESVKAGSLLNEQLVKVAGFGGQGVMSASALLAKCAVAEDRHATWLPSYGPEMRGGTANASVVISNDMIGAPVVEDPNVLIAMNAPSLDLFEESVQAGGMLIVNSSLIERKAKRDDINVMYAPVTDIAIELGSVMTATIVALAIYAAASGAVSVETIQKMIPSSIKRKNLVDINLKAVEAGLKYYKEHYSK